MGSSHKEEGPPPNPIILMIAAIRASLDHKGVSPHRIQHEDTSRVGRKGGAGIEPGAIFCHELTSRPLCWMWPQSPKGTSQSGVCSFGSWLSCPLLCEASQDPLVETNLPCLQLASPTPSSALLFFLRVITSDTLCSYLFSLFPHVVGSVMLHP